MIYVRGICLLLKEEMVTDYVNEKGLISDEKGIAVWGQIMPKLTDHMIGGLFSSLQVQYNVLYVTNSKLIIIPINNVTGKIVEENHVILTKEEITSVNWRKKLFGYELYLESIHGILTFKVNKFMIGAKWHKENLDQFIKLLG